MDNHLIWKIKDYMEYSPKQEYDSVITALQKRFNTCCGDTCRFRRRMFYLLDIDGVPPPPLMVRSTCAICENCHSANVSLYEHDVCFSCAVRGTHEFNYHHSRCANFVPVEVVEEPNGVNNLAADNFEHLITGGYDLNIDFDFAVPVYNFPHVPFEL